MEAAPLSLDRAALAALGRQYELELMLLCGSRATGHTHPESDTDFGVLRVHGTVPANRILDLRYRLYRLAGAGEVDVVDLRRVSGLGKHLACEHGRLLYEDRPGAFAQFRVLAWSLCQAERTAIRRHDSKAIQIALEHLAR